MIFNNLKDKCNYYRDLTDYKLIPNCYILVMIDGKNFSKLIKNKFEKPFDDWFISTMDKTAVHLCKDVQNCVGAFVQSDEISLIIKDNTSTCAPYMMVDFVNYKVLSQVWRPLFSIRKSSREIYYLV